MIFIKKISKPLTSLIKPDYENWKPLKQENEALMRKLHETNEIYTEKNGISNMIFDIETSI